MLYKTLKQLEKLSPVELIKEKKKFIKARETLLLDASEWKVGYKHLCMELHARLDLLELEETVAEDDRLFAGLHQYDNLCRIH